jgi:hypothetical protein
MIIGKRFGEKKFSSRGMYMRSIADIPKLYEIPNPAFKKEKYIML